MRFNKYLWIEILFLCTLLFSCKEKHISQTSCPRSELDILMDKAKWELYKLNLLEGDSARQFSPSLEDINLVDRKLSEFDLVFEWHKIKGDTISFFYQFENGIGPVHSYYCSYSFWGNDSIVGINLLEKLGFYHQPLKMESEFHTYLRENKEILSNWLIKAATERGVFE